ncbi:hypothetical protein HPB51_014766 [Rhipicephalus microplus]|uniref:Homeobox domain-containing protein n=1 Tax=Rhipicephalus microplus TaxID=6941 RepID=A0A9J6DMP2_RHIMP|nr:hypothetical protein HPB51_014766 [Rhipicephalus microplus]
MEGWLGLARIYVYSSAGVMVSSTFIAIAFIWTPLSADFCFAIAGTNVVMDLMLASRPGPSNEDACGRDEAAKESHKSKPHWPPAYPDLTSAYLQGGGGATSWPSSAFPISPAVSSVEALAGSGFPAQQQPLSPSTSDALQAAGRELRKARRNRTVFTEGQLMGLERRFDSQKYLSTPDRADLARVLGLTQLQVKTWYQNRRMKWKKQVMQGGCAVPPTKPKGRPKKNSIPSLAQCQQAQRQLALAAASARPPAVTDSMASFDTRNGYPR